MESGVSSKSLAQKGWSRNVARQILAGWITCICGGQCDKQCHSLLSPLVLHNESFECAVSVPGGLRVAMNFIC